MPSKDSTSDLCLLQSIESLVEWPWDAETNLEAQHWKLGASREILTFTAWCVMIGFNKLPHAFVAE